LFKDSERGRRITVGGPRFIGPDTKIFAMGSCFAVEIRRALRQKGLAVYPDYPGITFDPATQMAGRLPERDNINHYDTFVIRQKSSAPSREAGGARTISGPCVGTGSHVPKRGRRSFRIPTADTSSQAACPRLWN